jgi:AcrR family transcriptional regulator
MERSDKRDAVMQAALELVGENGFHGSPMAMIAQRAGVAAGTIYRYFESKDLLIRETYGRLEQQVLATVKEEYPEDEPIREQYLHVCRQLFHYFLASPLEFRFIEQFHNSPYGVACRRDKILGKKDKDLITELFEEGQAQQILKELPLPVFFALTFGPLCDLCRDHILQFIVLDEPLIVKTAEACWDAVKR